MHDDDRRRALVFERRIALGLQWGTWLACAVIAAGLAIPPAAVLVKVGIATFVALPILRVIAMLVEFLRRRELGMSVIAGLVLGVIFAAILVSLYTGHGEG